MPSFQPSTPSTKKRYPPKNLFNDTSVSSWSSMVTSFPTTTHLKVQHTKKSSSSSFKNEKGKKHTFSNPHQDALSSCTTTSSKNESKTNHHPDDSFFSGAWLFDFNQAPSWLKKELGLTQQQKPLFNPWNTTFVHRTQTATTTTLTKPYNEKEPFLSNPNTNNMKVQAGKKQTFESPMQKKETFTSPCSFLESGGWLFDVSQSPHWFQQLIQLDVPTQGSFTQHQQLNPSTFHAHAKENNNKHVHSNVNLNLKISSLQTQPPIEKEKNKTTNTKEEKEEYQFCSWLLDPAHSPEWFKPHVSFPNTTSRPTSPTSNPSSSTCSPPLSHKKQPRTPSPSNLVVQKGAQTDKPNSTLTSSMAHPIKPSFPVPTATRSSFSSFSSSSSSRSTSVPPPSDVNSTNVSTVKAKSKSHPIHHRSSHLELGFESGAWLFDVTPQAPSWLRDQLHNPQNNNPTRSSTKNGSMAKLKMNDSIPKMDLLHQGWIPQDTTLVQSHSKFNSKSFKNRASKQKKGC